MEERNETVGDWLKRMAATNESNERDSAMMQNLLRRTGYPRARVLYGIVYLEGQGRPLDIHSIAKAVLAGVEAPVNACL